jgi:N-methylhydantoinase B
MGLRRVYRAERECRLRLDITRLNSRPWGLAGGLPGLGGAWRFSQGVEFHAGHCTLRAGDVVEVMTAGSGGYGPPEERSVEAVRRDIAEGAIDADTAREVYPAALARHVTG